MMNRFNNDAFDKDFNKMAGFIRGFFIFVAIMFVIILGANLWFAGEVIDIIKALVN